MPNKKKAKTKTPAVVAEQAEVTEVMNSHYYQSIGNKRLQYLIGNYHSVEHPTDVSGELAAMRAVFHAYVEQSDEMTQKLTDWHESWQSCVEANEAVIEAVTKMQKVYASYGMHQDPKGYKYIGIVSNWLEEQSKIKRVKPRKVDDPLPKMAQMLEKIVNTAYKVEEMRLRKSMSLARVKAVFAEMGRVVNDNVSDPGVQQRIKRGWTRIRFGDSR